MRANGRLRREEDRIGAVEDRVGDVAGLGAGRARGDDHRLEHLGRHDRRHAEVEGAPNELLLDDRHLLERQLDAEVAPGDHHRVGGPGDVVEVVDGGTGLDLGHDRQGRRAGQRPQLAHVVGAADERLRDVVRAQGRGTRGAARSSSVRVGRDRRSDGTLTPACGADRTAPHDLRADLRAGRQDTQLGGAIGQEDPVARPEILAEAGVADVRAGCVARRIVLGTQDEARRLR